MQYQRAMSKKPERNTRTLTAAEHSNVTSGAGLYAGHYLTGGTVRTAGRGRPPVPNDGPDFPALDRVADAVRKGGATWDAKRGQWDFWLLRRAPPGEG